MEKGSSPFTPGSPVPVELFVGRAQQILELMRYVDQAASGRQENVFLVGDRGVGKTSVSSFVRYWAGSEKDVLGVHVFLGGVSTLDEMVRRVFEALLKVTKGETWFDKVRGLFGDFITEVGLFGVSVGFSPSKEDLTQVVRSFPQSLHSMISGISNEKKVLLIALDDLNGLAQSPEFANWYKSFVDEIATHWKSFPVCLMLIGLPGMMDSLASLQPSLMRIFRVIELEKLSDDEVTEFLSKAFDEAGIEMKQEALSILVRFSSGLPVIMQEIGDATFWVDEDGCIDEDDAVAGVLAAAERIGRKYLNPQMYRAIRSEKYRSILRKLAMIESPFSRTFTRREVVAHLTEKEKRVFDNFLRRLKTIGIIESDPEMGRGTYRFVNDIYPIYIYMEANAFVSGEK